MKPRGRFEIVCVFKGGSYVKITSDTTRSLPPAEIVKCLREYADYLDAGAEADNADPKVAAAAPAP